MRLSLSKMVSSASAAASVVTASPSTIQRYLKAFSLKPDGSLPPVFNIKYIPEWSVFAQHFVAPTLDIERAKLYQVLEFCRYMKAIGINPFLLPMIDPVTRKAFVVDTVYQILAKEMLQAFSTRITSDIRKLRVASDFDARSTKLLVKEQRQKHMFNFAVSLVPKAGQSLDKLLPGLKGGLYQQPSIPMQLQESRSKRSSKTSTRLASTLPDSMVLLQDLQDYGWLKVKQDKSYAVAARRARQNTLVLRFRVSLPLEVVFGAKAQTINTLTSMWAKVKPVL